MKATPCLTALVAGLVVVVLSAGVLATGSGIAGASGRLQPAAAPGMADPPREEGAQLFKTWCASCHGRSAQGDGVLAPMMRQVVPDLTGIATRNGGVFPTAYVRRIIDGREVRAHGDPEMPVWGTAFRETAEGYSEAAVRARIDALVAYLDTIQRRNAH